jgi:hypothetical protein
VKDIATLDLATGDVRHLPNITAATAGFPPTLWRLGTSVAAGIMLPADPNRTALALLDFSNDVVTPLLPREIPMRWSPDGKTLLATTAPNDGNNPPIYAVNPAAPADQSGPLPNIIHQMIGFVRTSDGPVQGSVAPALADAAFEPALASARVGPVNALQPRGALSC